MEATDAQLTRNRSLFVFDAGEWTLTGCTADEVEQLLADPRAGKAARIYRIHRAFPDGRMELQGVSRERFELESGMFFHQSEEAAARTDFDELCARAESSSPPVRAYIQLARVSDAEGGEAWVTALVYPAEAEEDVSAWLLAGGFSGGAFVEGGISATTSYLQQPRDIVERRQLWSARQSRRSVDDLLAVRTAKSAG